MADARCATPTQAAVRVTPDQAALHRQLDALAARLTADARRLLRFERQRVASAARHPVLADPAGALRIAARRMEMLSLRLSGAAAQGSQRQSRRLDALRIRLGARRPDAAFAAAGARHTGLESRLSTAARRGMQSAAARVGATERHLQSVGPAAVLARGYSCTRLPDGTIARSIRQFSAGDRITTFVADGSVASRVEGASGRTLAEPRPGAAKGPAARRPSPKPAPGRDTPPQLDLFGGTGYREGRD